MIFPKRAKMSFDEKATVLLSNNYCAIENYNLNVEWLKSSELG